MRTDKEMIYIMLIELKWRYAYDKCGCMKDDCVACDNDEETLQIIKDSEKQWPDIYKVKEL